MVARGGIAGRGVAGLAAVCLLLAALGTGCGRETDTTDDAKPARIDGGSAVPYTVRTLDLPYASCGRPQRIGSSLYTTVSRGAGKGDSVIRYDLETHSTETVAEAPDPEIIGWFSVNEDWLVWSVGTQLYARYRKTGEEQVVSATRDLYAPALNGDLLAWDDLTPERTHQIVIRDLGQKETTAIAPLELPDLYNNFPTWNGDDLLWTDVTDDTGHYRVYNSLNRDIRDYALSEIRFRYPGYALGLGKRLYSINFDRTDEWDWTLQQVGYYAIDERRFVPIVPDGFIANSLRLTNEFVAIVDEQMRLTLRPADAPVGDSTVYEPVESNVDFVETSPDGTVIATHESTDGSPQCTLYLIEPR